MVTTENKPSTPDPRRNSAGLRRDLEILETLATPEALSAGGLGVLQLSALVGRDKGMISRTLATLAESGLISRDPITRNYRLGHKLFALAAQTFESHLVHVARPYLRQLEIATGETTHLSVLRGGNVLTLASQESNQDIRGRSWEGMTTAAWQTPSGRVLLSDWTDQALREWYEVHRDDPAVLGVAPQALPNGKPLVKNFDSLKHEINRVRRQGFAVVDEEFELGVVAVSVPVFDSRKSIIAALNVSAPKSRFGSRLGEAGKITVRVAAEISASLTDW
ncbi:IclR family transcriptional regulator [Cryobacterium algoritolerans]|uniref:IclR family transcriptional regulator n=1 Tax=Cryobacterium algoritolerans TaxID=1259184 RepID=A0A4R8WYJ4_9MICO|nr:IclR family transcriptional regulator [Cryobacterium algoritolerans]TFC18613.1 IclR family transcriptional regulator [Cryobacterium algoritolerans]